MRRQRIVLEKSLAEIRRLPARPLHDHVAERLPSDVIGAQMRELSVRQKKVEAELAVVPEAPGVAGLLSAALHQNKACIGDLASMFAAGISPDTEDAAARIRTLVA